MLYRLKHYNNDNKLETYKLCFYDSDTKELTTQDEADGYKTIWSILASLLDEKSNNKILLYRGNKCSGELSYDMVEDFVFDEPSYTAITNIANSSTDPIHGVFVRYGFNRDKYYHVYLSKKDYDSITTINYYKSANNGANLYSIQYNSKDNSLDISCDDALFDIIKYYRLNNKTMNVYANNAYINQVTSRYCPIISNNCTLTFEYKPIDFNFSNQINAHIIFNDCKEEFWTNENGEITKSINPSKPLDTNQQVLIMNGTKCGIYDSSSNIITLTDGLDIPFLNALLNKLHKGEAEIITSKGTAYLSYTEIKSVTIPKTYTKFDDVFGDGTCIIGPTHTPKRIFTAVKFISCDRLKKFKLIDNGSGLNDFKITEDKLCLNNHLFSTIIENNYITLPNIRVIIFGEYEFPRRITGTNNCTFIYYDDDAYTHHLTSARDQLYALPLHGNKNYKIVTIPALETLCCINEDGVITETIIEN